MFKDGPPTSAPDKHVAFVSWSPHLKSKTLLVDEGVIVFALQEHGHYAASLRAHKGACGGGIFSLVDGTLAGMHVGLQHSARKKNGAKPSAKLSGEKDGYAIFVGRDALKGFFTSLAQE